MALYVEPAHRGTKMAAELIARYVDWAREMGVPEGFITAGISTGQYVEQTARLYEAMGFKRFGVLLEA
jgi:GNAT superfamily N-acetyltransferase